MTNKWTVNGVEAPARANCFAYGKFRDTSKFDFPRALIDGVWCIDRYTTVDILRASDYQECSNQPSSDYAFCLSEAINKLKHCADVAPDDKRKDALLEIVDGIEFIKNAEIWHD